MTWTVNSASREWGIARETLVKRLEALSIPVKPGAKFHTRQITQAIVGDLNHERMLETIERRKLLEKENAEKDGTLVEMEAVQRLITDAMLPVRQRFMALPNEAASRCNPSDPTFARDALQRWVDDSLPLIREKLPKGKEAKG